MSDIFKAGKRKYHRGSISVSFTMSSDAMKRFQKLNTGGEKALKRLVSDFSSRAPGWVSQGLREHYNIKGADIKQAHKKTRRGANKVDVAGITVDGATLVYEGYQLTPLHYGMKPKKWKKRSGKKKVKVPGEYVGSRPIVATIRPQNPYTITAEVVRGQTETMAPDTFLAKSRYGPILPFQRRGEERKDIEVVRGPSVPELIDGPKGMNDVPKELEGYKDTADKARKTINEIINKNLEKRLNNHITNAMR